MNALYMLGRQEHEERRDGNALVEIWRLCESSCDAGATLDAIRAILDRRERERAEVWPRS